MVRMKVRMLDSGTTRTYFGSEREMEATLRRLFPEDTENTHRFLAAVDAVNKEGFAEVDVEPYREPVSRNVLPPDYDRAEQPDDPWPREADES